MSQRHSSRAMKKGFTLIELLIVTSLVVLVMLSISSLFMTVLLGSARTNIKRQIKAEGAEIIDKLEFHLRGAKSVTAGNGTNIQCSENGTNADIDAYTDGINITSIDDAVINIQYDSGTRQLFINQDPNNGGTSQPLNTTYAIATLEPEITCFSDPNTNKSAIRINFSLGRTENSTTLQQNFSAYAQLRNS